ncbi:MAG: YdcF family protein [Sedimenticola sp.]
MDELLLRHLAKVLVLPPGSLIIALVLSLLFWRRWWARLLMLFTVALFYLLSTSFGAEWLAKKVETLPAVTIQQVQQAGAQGILVFLGDVYSDAQEYQDRDTIGDISLRRLHYAVYLHRQTGLPLVLSGGLMRNIDKPLAQLGAEVLDSHYGLKPLALETNSRNSGENARFSAQLLDRLGIAKVVLVTDAFHMRRSLYSARQAGMDVVPAPANFVNDYKEQARGFREWLPYSGYLHQSRMMLHEWIGFEWYRLVGERISD